MHYGREGVEAEKIQVTRYIHVGGCVVMFRTLQPNNEDPSRYGYRLIIQTRYQSSTFVFCYSNSYLVPSDLCVYIRSTNTDYTNKPVTQVGSWQDQSIGAGLASAGLASGRRGCCLRVPGPSGAAKCSHRVTQAAGPQQLPTCAFISFIAHPTSRR